MRPRRDLAEASGLDNDVGAGDVVERELADDLAAVACWTVAAVPGPGLRGRAELTAERAVRAFEQDVGALGRAASRATELDAEQLLRLRGRGCEECERRRHEHELLHLRLLRDLHSVIRLEARNLTVGLPRARARRVQGIRRERP